MVLPSPRQKTPPVLTLDGAEGAVAAFGGGCHWCTEAVFDHAPGVLTVRQGFAAGPPPHSALSEAALVTWGERVTFEKLIRIHLDTHSAGSDHALRGRYRSAVYVTGAAQAALARSVLDDEAARRGPLVTHVLPLVAWQDSPPRYRRYYRTRPDAPFCRVHIAPKLARLRAAEDA